MSETTGSGLTPSSPSTSSESSSACTARTDNMAVTGSGLPSAKKSFIATAGGSGLSLKVPEEVRSLASPSRQAATLPCGAPLKILLAEDNPGDIFLVQGALENERLQVELCVKKDGEEMLRCIEAIDAGKENCPDLVLLDLNLPKYSGALLLEKMRASSMCAEIPIVIVTSSDAPKDREAASQYRANYFRKPSDFDEFMRLGHMIRGLLPR